MGDERPADQDHIQTQGRKDNAALPLNAAPDNAGAERYPSVKKDDSVEPRSFEGGGDNPEPRQGAGDGGPGTSANEGRLGRGGDPAEGKR
ncbi:MAG: hypothetical protein JNK30_22370 [Phenylobacterium sp.]|uniref:hypothetical protein n=1 Tax=Phenylobacterium sp. TaxID=1871053 RepID=UPI001A575DED|nr:hypothetical protein [Phenylobacterium sp.]MBL8774150.1 hypothetical protein [Phenylobacterium sp.]